MNDDKTELPSGPQSEKGRPECAVKWGIARAGILVGVSRELLTKRKLDNRLFRLPAEQVRDCRDEDRRVSEEVSDHVAILRNRGRIV